MAAPLGEFFADVHASDIFDYGVGYRVYDFLEREVEVFRPDWIITNPPFNAGSAIIEKARTVAMQGVCCFVATSFLSSQSRYRYLFADRPPSLIAHFVERVPLKRGVYDPKGSTATDYAWLIWRNRGRTPIDAATTWFPPGTKARHFKRKDVERFCRPTEVPLFTGHEPQAAPG